MIPADFEYVRAHTLREALNALASGDGSKLIAGGHSLIPLLRFRLAQPAKLVDIGQLAELKGIAAKGRGARIGAASTYRELLDSELLRERYPLLLEATHTIGDLQVRNAGTIGGGLAHADPAADMPAVMLALDAEFVLRGKSGKRSVPAREFFKGPFTTVLAESEVLTDIVLPPLPRGAGTAYVSFEQKASGYPLAGAAAVVARSRKTVNHAVVALTGVGEAPSLVAAASTLVGTKGEPEAVRAVAAGAVDGTVNSDIHAPAEYRTQLARVAVRRALELALSRAH